MKITNNLTNDLLLFNQPMSIYIWDNDGSVDNLIKIIQVKSINFKDWRFNDVVKVFMQINIMDEDDFKKHFYMFDKITNPFNFYYYGLKFYADVLASYIVNFIEFFKIVGINITIKNQEFYIDDLALNKELYEEILNYIKISSCIKPNTKQIKNPKLEEYEKKINKIKKSNKKITGNNRSIDEDFEKSFMILTYDFGYKPNEILEMNLYQIKTIISYAGSVTNYKLSLIAHGNGLSKKKLYHYTEKGKK